MSQRDAALAVLALLAVLGGSVATASAATPGFAVYSVQFSSPGHSYSLTVNETVAATASPSTDSLILKVAAQAWNFNYSRSINSSSMVSPFLPSVTSQSLSYSYGSDVVNASIADNGTSSLQFAGQSYTLTDYALSAAVTFNGTSVAVSGSLSAFSSGLIYSLDLSSSGLPAASLAAVGNVTGIPTGPVNVSLTLLSTSLPLNADSASTAAQAASIGLGAGAAVSALALGLGVRHRGKQKPTTSEEKPEHWVD